MTQATVPGGTQTTYSYDNAGNRTSIKVGAAAAVTTAYDAASYPVSSSDGTRYTTDATGALTKVEKGTARTAYRYDAFGRMRGATVGASQVSYSYDALDRTVSRTQGATTTTYAYAGDTEELVFEKKGSVNTSYAVGPGGPLARKVVNGGTTTIRYLLRDTHGDVVALVGLAGGLPGTASFSPWGELRAKTGEGTTLGFQGDPTDPTTGAVDMGARDYLASLGRFTTADPLFGDPKVPGTLNPFTYAVGNPVTLDDPTGMCPPQYCYDPGWHGPGHSARYASKLVPRSAAFTRSWLASHGATAYRPTPPPPLKFRFTAAREGGIRLMRQSQPANPVIPGYGPPGMFTTPQREGQTITSTHLFLARNGACGGCLDRYVTDAAEVEFVAGLVGTAAAAATRAVIRAAARTTIKSTAKSLVGYDADFAVGQVARGFRAKASDLVEFGTNQGWKRVQSGTGPIRLVDDNGIQRLILKRGSPRTPGSGYPHVEIRNATGQRVDVFGNVATRRSPGNHTPIIWDL